MQRSTLLSQTRLLVKDNSHHTWVSNSKTATKEDKELFLKGLVSNKSIWETLGRILLSWYEAKSGSNNNFDSPNWLEKECFNKGYMKALEDIYKIIPKTNEE